MFGCPATTVFPTTLCLNDARGFQLGYTPLLEAAMHGCEDITELLLEAGAHVDCENNVSRC